MRASRAQRVARAAGAAGIATFAALMGHVAAGGEVPGIWGLVTPLVLSWGVCTALAGRRLPLLRLAFAVVISQALFHALFMLGSPSPSGRLLEQTGRHHADPAAVLASGVIGEHAHAQLPMSTAHVLAAAITVAALHVAERAVSRAAAVVSAVIAWMASLWRRMSAGPRCAAPRVRTTFSIDAQPHHRTGLASISRRGPPRLRAV